MPYLAAVQENRRHFVPKRSAGRTHHDVSIDDRVQHHVIVDVWEFVKLNFQIAAGRRELARPFRFTQIRRSLPSQCTNSEELGGLWTELSLNPGSHQTFTESG